ASWKFYPDNIGHSIWPGCIRCHDGQHMSADNRVITNDCNSCHAIIAQGPGLELGTVSAKGLEFQHPGGDIGKELLCGNCHGGALVE
ncbi:MAG: cytochrome C, partial [Thermodesulfobacteriota bacterium]